MIKELKRFDIIRFYAGGQKKRLIKSQVTEQEKDEWCNHPKTKKVGKWFDGFTSKMMYSCQTGKALYPSGYNPDNL